MKVLCEGCEESGAERFCLDCRKPLCGKCLEEAEDEERGGKRGHIGSELKTVLTSGFISALAFCDMCDWRPASVRTVQDGQRKRKRERKSSSSSTE